MNKMELLAPAGNFECLVAAVQSGADAVYLSGKAFGARSFADNFNNEELERAVDYCHIRDVKVYVTVNTLVGDLEFKEVSDYLLFLNQIGVDAIIVQDLGVIKLAQSIVPELPVHASTQVTVHNSEGVRFLETLGIKRVVLSREVSLSDINKISENTTAELEVFGHGALCMSYSGQCLMSSIIGGRSGNRGKCAQPCRLPYSRDGKSEKAFYLSLKDLSSLNHIKKLQSIGVTSLKIEGRMKGPSYVAAVVRVYRKYIDSLNNVEESDIKLLDTIFNRGGLTDGYLTQKTGPHMFAFDKPDNPYKKGSNALETQLLNSIKTENKKLSLECEVWIKTEKFPRIIVKGKGLSVEYIGEKVPEKAAKLPLDKETVKLHINKTGGTPFEFSEVSVNLDDGLFVSIGDLNILRRKALQKFENEYINSFKRKNKIEALPQPSDEETTLEGGYVCEVTNLSQFFALKDFSYKLFYIPLSLIEKNPEVFREYRDKIVIVPPSIIPESEQEKVFGKIEELLNDGFYALLALNVASMIRFKNFRIIGGFRLNVFNSYALGFLKTVNMECIELSPELNLKQISALKKPLPVQVMVYGRLPLMLTENCISKNLGKCPCDEKAAITDRIGMTFPIIKDGDSCRNVLLNCKKTFMAFDMEKVKNSGVGFFRLYFTDESPEECIRVSESFLNNGNYRPDDHTGGHFVKGVL